MDNLSSNSISRMPKFIAWAILTLLLVVPTAIFGSDYLWGYFHWKSFQKNYASEDFETSKANLFLCLKTWPKSADVHLQLAKVARRDADFNLASAALALARKFGATSADIEFEQLLLDTSANGWQKTRDALNAKIEENHPESARIHESLAKAFYAQYLLGTAEKHVDKWLELEPESANAWLLKGSIRERLSGGEESSIEAYTKALNIKPNLHEARVGRGIMYSTVKKPQEAIEDLRIACAERPNEKDPRVGLLRALTETYEMEEAKQHAFLLLNRFPNDRDVLSAVGRLEVELKQYTAAEQHLRAATKIVKDPLLLRDLMRCLVILKETDEAKKIEQLLTQVDQDLKRLRELSRIIAVTLDPAPRVEAGVTMIRNGYFLEGEGWLQDALQIAPNYGPAHSALANFYATHNNPQKAAYHRQMSGNQ